MGKSKRSSQREVYNDTGLPQETRKISQINILTLEKEEQTKPKVSRGRRFKKEQSGNK